MESATQRTRPLGRAWNMLPKGRVHWVGYIECYPTYPGSNRAVPDTRVEFDSDTQCTRHLGRIWNMLPKGRVISWVGYRECYPTYPGTLPG